MNRRDIELLISAKDTSGRTFQQVASNIRELADTIDRQSESAARGELKLSELQATQAKLGEVGQELAGLQSVLDLFNKLTDSQTKNEAKLAELKAAHEALTATIGKTGTATAAQDRTLASLEKQIGSFTTRVTEGKTALDAQAISLQKAGIDSTNLAGAQQLIVNSARQVGQSLVTARTSVSDFDTELYRTATAARAAGEAIDLGFANKGLRFQENTKFLNTLIADMQRAEVQAKESALALANFQQIGKDALAAQSAGSGAGAGASGAQAANLSAIGNALQSIVQPGRAALQTLDGIDAAVAEQAAVLDGGKKQIQDYSSALNKLNEAGAALIRAGGLIDSFKNQQVAVDEARAKLDQAEAEVRQYGQAMASATAPSEALAKSLRDAQTAAATAGRQLATENTKLTELSGACKRAGVDVNNLAAAETRLAATAQKTATATAGLQSKTSGKGLFGLDAYQVQNLGFQLNDVFTSIASGGLNASTVLRTMAQQGGQITQIFPGAIGTIARFALAFSPLIIAGIAAAVVIGGLIDRAQQLEAFKNALRVNVDGTFYDPQKLEQISIGLQNIGVSSADATAAILEFVNKGIDPSKIEAFSITAAEMAEVMGTKVPDAAKALADGLTGGYDAVVKLDDSTNILTASEREHAKALFDGGETAKARQYVFDTIKGKMDDMAHASRSNWQIAANNFHTAWNNMLDAIGVTQFIKDAKSDIDDLSVAVSFLSGLLSGQSIDEAGKAAVAANSANRAATDAARQRQQVQQRQKKIDDDYLTDLRETTQATKGITQAEYVRRKGLEALRRAQNANLSGPAAAEAQRIAQDAARRDLRDNPDMLQTGAQRKGAAAQRHAEAAARAAQRRAEAAQRHIAEVSNTLTTQLREIDQRVSRGASQDLETRLGAIDLQYEKIFDTLKKLRALGITKLDGTSLDVIEARVNASKAQLKTEETLKYYEQSTNDLVKQRKAEIDAIADAQKRGSISVLEATQQAAAVDAKYRPQIIESAQKALEIARAVAGTKPNPEMQALITSLERVIRGETTGNILDTSQAEVGLAGLAQQEKKLNDMISDRNALVESYNQLRQAGLISEDELRTKTAAAYAATGPAILQQTAALRQTLDMLKALGIITPVVYDTWIAKIAAVNQQTQYVDARIAQINQTAQTAIADGITNAFKTASDTIVGLISGTMSWGDALDSVLNLGLSLVGNFLSSLAQVLVQMVALKAAQAIIGGSTGGFGGLFFHSGGVVGRGSGRRTGGNAPASVWAAAPRLHGGGGLGLGPDEYRAVLKRNEEVLTADDPRNAINGGGMGQGPSGGQDPGLKQVLVLDPNEIPRAMQGKAGQRTVMTIIRTNKETIKQQLGIK